MKTFVSIPGNLRNEPIEEIIDTTLKEISQETGIIHKKGFCIKHHLENNQILYHLDSFTNKYRSPFSVLYWNISMKFILQELDHHDALLTLSYEEQELPIGMRKEIYHAHMLNKNIYFFNMTDNKLY